MTRVTCCAVFVAVVLSGCRLDGRVDVAVDGGGGGTLALTLVADEELRRAAADAGADPLAVLERSGGRLTGWQVQRTEGAGVDPVVTLSTRFRDPAELERISTQLSGGLAGPELQPLGPMRLEVTDDTVTLAGTADLRVSKGVSELGLTRRQALRRLADGLVFRVTARMPGEILRTDADERPDDTTAVWIITPGQRRSLEVSAVRPWSLGRVLALVGTPLRLAVVAAPVVALAVLAGVWWRRRQRPQGDGGAAGRDETHDGGKGDDDVVRPAAAAAVVAEGEGDAAVVAEGEGDPAVVAEGDGDAAGEGNVAVVADEAP